MNRIFQLALVLFSLLIPFHASAAPPNNEFITLNLPQTVLARIVNKMVPFDVNVSSRALKGAVSIISIQDIRLQNQQISCKLGLIGKNLRLVTEIAGHKINLNVGTVRLNFHTDARLRFDARKQILYIRPILKNNKRTAAKKADIGNALLAFISGRDFPVAIKKLKPLIADTNHKSVMIGMSIRNIEAVNGALKMSIVPSIHNINPTRVQKK